MPDPTDGPPVSPQRDPKRAPKKEPRDSTHLAFGIAQLAIAAVLVLGSRVLTGVRPDLAGILDDATLAALYLSGQGLACAGRRRPPLHGALSIAVVVLFSVAVFTNQVFFSFFHTYLRIAAVQLAGIVVDASSSVTELLTPANVIALLLLPIGGHIFALRSRWTSPLGLSREAGWALLFGALLLAGVGSMLRDPVFLFAQQNPTLSLVRDASNRAFASLGIADEPAEEHEVFGLLNREGYPGYEPGASPDRPLLQRPRSATARTTADLQNVVVILMESMRALEMQGAYRELPVTPVLNALESSSVVFPNFYANGMTTVDGEFSILCSALPVVNEAPVYVRSPELAIRCLPEILRDHGYETHWISAYAASYANKEKFLTGHGIDRVHDEASMDPAKQKHPDVGWGLGDVDMFEQAITKLDGFREPFFAEVMTLSNHHPFDHEYDIDFPRSFSSVRGNRHYRDYLRGMYYTDHAVGRFLEEARKRPWFERTLFVVLGDHAVRAFPAAPGGGSLGPVLETEIYFRNPLLLHAPGFLAPARHGVLGSQIDVAPTILDVLGIRAENSFLGVSLLADVPSERRFALMNIGHVFNIRSGSQYCYSVGYSCFEGVFPRCRRGVRPVSLGHTCFEHPGDLLRSTPGEAPRTLDALERTRTLDRARRIMELNRRMIDEDRFR